MYYINRLISSVSIILVLDFLAVFTSGRWTDKYDSYDTAHLRNDYLSRYCLATQSSTLTDQERKVELQHFLNCSQPGLLFPNISNIGLSSEEFYERNRTEFQNWCSTWKSQRDCEEKNQKYVDECFTADPSISVGFDLLTGFFESACAKNGEPIPDLILFLHKVREWCWFDERQILSCFHQTNLHYFRRNIKLILPCLRNQLQYCGRNDYNSLESLSNILKEIETGYSSSRYVYLISVNTSEINNNEAFKFPKCANVSFAYIVIFVLLALILITLGAFAFMKVRSLNLLCFKKPSTLVENDGNAVEL